MSHSLESRSGSSLAVVSQRTVGDLTGLNLGGSLEIRERIGSGGMGSVYLAHYRDWGLSLAVKSPRPDLLSEETDKERWLLEAQTWIDLGVHPNIVRCWFIREHRGIPLLFLDYVAGGSLKEAIDQRRFGLGNWGKFLDLAIQACDGLAHAHDSGIVHRDVKPANFLLDDEGRLYVTDFGLVKLQGSAEESSEERDFDVEYYEGGLTSTGTVLGTPNYCAPEQWLQGDVGTSADLYALGVVLYEMCVGQLPFEAGPGPLGLGQLLSKVLTEEPQPPRLLQPSLPEPLEAIILKLLAKEPEDRPASAHDLRDQLTDIYYRVTGSTYPRPRPKPVEAVVDVLNNKAVSLYSLGRPEPAEETWHEALHLDSLHPDVVYNRGLILWREGEQTAYDLLNTLRQVRLTYARSALHCGLAHLWTGEWEAAEQHLSEAATLSELATGSLVWRFLGDARMGLERFAEAEAAYQTALTINPGDDAGRLHLELARKKTRRFQGRCLFPRQQPLLKMNRQHRLNQVVEVAGGWLWLGADHMELLPADKSRRSWSVRHDVGLRKVVVSSAASRIIAIESLPAGIWSLHSGELLETLEQGERYFGMTPDGLYGVAGLVDLRLTELTSHRSSTTFRGHEKQVLCTTFFQSGERLLSGSCDRTARCWDVRRGTCLMVFQGHRDYVTALATCSETGVLLTGSRDRTVKAWKLDSGNCFLTLEEGAPVQSVTLLARGRFAVVQASSGAETWTSCWDLKGGQLLGRYDGTSKVSPDGRFLVTASSWDGESQLAVRELGSGCLRRVISPAGQVTDFNFSQDGRFLAVVTAGGDFFLYEFDEAARVLPQELLLTNTRGGQDLEEDRNQFLVHLRASIESFKQQEYPKSLGFLEAARKVGGYRRDPQARALARKLSRHLARGELSSCWEVRLLAPAGGPGHSPVLLLPAGELILTANDKVLRLWDGLQGSCLREFSGHSETIRAIDMDVHGARAISGSLDRGIRCWDLRSGAPIGRCQVSRGGVIALHWVPESSRVVALTNQYSICGVDLEESREVYQLPISGATWMQGLKKRNQVWIGGPQSPGQFQILEASSGKVARGPQQWRAPAESTLLATATVILGDAGQGLSIDPEGKVHLWDLLEGRHLAKILQVENRVEHLASSPDGMVLAMGLENGWVQIWDLQNRRLCQVLEGPWGKLAGLTMSGDACELYILGSDGILRIWEMEWELLETPPCRSLLETIPKEGLFRRFLRSFKR